MAWTLADSSFTHELEIQIGVFCAGLFLACMFCHGELVRLKPAPALPDALLPDDLARRRARLGARRDRRAARAARVLRARRSGSSPARCCCCGRCAATALVFGVLAVAVADRDDRLRHLGRAASSTTTRSSRTRNFYGVLRVQESATRRRQAAPVADPRHDPARQRSTCDPDVPPRSRPPTTRDAPASAALLEALHPTHDAAQGRRDRPRHRHARDLRRQGRRLPLLRHQSGRDRRSRSATSPTSATATRRSRRALGDARLSLEREPPQKFDVLAIDAFSSDAIPVHLITCRGARRSTCKHMKPGGVIAFHVTNRFLEPRARRRGARRRARTARDLDRRRRRGRRSRAAATGCCCRTTARVARRPALAEPRRRVEARRDWRLWTDDFNNLVQVLK